MPTKGNEDKGLRRIVSDLARKVRRQDRAAGVQAQAQAQQAATASSIVWLDPVSQVFTATGSNAGGAFGPWEPISFNDVPSNATSVMIEVKMSFSATTADIQLGMEYRINASSQSYPLADQHSSGDDAASTSARLMLVNTEIPPPDGQAQVRFRRDGTTWTYTIRLRGYTT